MMNPQRVEARVQQGGYGRADGVEAGADGLAGEVAGVDALGDDGQLQVAQRAVEGEPAQVAAGAGGVPRGQFGAGRKAGVGGGGVAYAQHRRADRVPVDEHQPQVGERVAERGHLPVHDRPDRAGVAGVEDGVVEPVVAVHDRRTALRRCRPLQRAVQSIQGGQ
ncbi:hypothetical protein Prum_001100 [Phytohabitans rumicis]|uniref:Uncharacterized protein n=1 Tax=Phytohabitans rumicis TaxID=1076125 RepID=A0A6V8KUS5_9ACTN|nr:hypothetical protein Prum_001100 [Phytohabitans rumicis]